MSKRNIDASIAYGKIMLKHDTGKVSSKAAANELAHLVHQDSTRIMREQAAIYIKSVENDLFVLQVNDSTKIPIGRIRTEKRPAYTDNADACMVAMEADDGVGVGMAHVNTFNMEYHRRSALKLIQAPPNQRVRLGKETMMQTPTQLALQLMKLPDRIASALETVGAAMRQFDKLDGSKTNSPTRKVMLGGCDYIPKAEIPEVENAVRTHVSQRRGKGVDVEIHLGQIGGIIYGGPQDQDFPKPTFITRGQFADAMKRR